MSSSLSIVRISQVATRTGRCRSALYAQIKEGLFPKPIKLSARAAGWPLHEIDALVAARVAGRSDNEIRALVTRLEASRTAADRGH